MLEYVLKLSADEFENLTFDLLVLLGLKNAVWRTPGRDVGRDIQGDFFVHDLSGFVQKQVWYVECKRYEKSVDWPTVWEKISYAESDDADMLLIVTSSSLSPQCIDQVNCWNNKRKRPMIRFWPGVELQNKIKMFPQLLVKYSLSVDPKIEAAASMLPLTRIALKLTNSAYSASVFGLTSGKALEAAAAVTDLISARLDEIESFGKINYHVFSPQEDGYEWLENAALVHQMAIDKYASRAVLSYLRYALKLDRILVQPGSAAHTVTLVCSNTLLDSQIDDLNSVTLWGDLRVYVKGKVSIARR